MFCRKSQNGNPGVLDGAELIACASAPTDLTCRVFAGKFERWRCWRNVEDVYLRRVRRLASPQIFFDVNPPV
jgi:hypothetical protein